MTQYIDKAAVVAEIERLISNGQTKLKESEECKDYESYIALAERIATCINLLSFIDTLEVKEVDLKKEINKYISDNFFGSQTMGFFAARTKEEPNYQDIALCAKHFFEFGLKAQKGE